MSPEIGERAILARIDSVGASLEKANPDELGKAIRLLDAMKRLAVGKKWVTEIGHVDAWALKARRRAGEIIEASQPGEGARTPGTGRRGTGSAPRREAREELGITEHESSSFQALARIPEPVFEEFVEKVYNREEEGTITRALEVARAEETGPVVRTTVKRSHDQILIDDLAETTERWLEVAGADTLEEIENEKVLDKAIEILEKVVEYAQRQIEKLQKAKP